MGKKLAIVGYGRMGRMIEQLAPDYDFDVALKVDIENNANFEAMTAENFAGIDVAIEFSIPDTVVENIVRLAGLGVNTVVWVEPSDQGGATVSTLTRAGARQTQVAQGAPPGELDRVSRSLAAEAKPQPPPSGSGKEKKEDRARPAPSVWKRYWWAWAAIGVVVVGTAVIVPVAVTSGSDGSGRPVVLDLP